MDEPDTKASHASTVASVSSVSTASSSATSGASNLHCTLFLFDDKLMIVKRQSSTVSGRKVTGLDDMQKLIKTGGGVAVMDKAGAKKDKLSFRGTVDILDIIATDVGNGGTSISHTGLTTADLGRVQLVPGKTARSVRAMVSTAPILQCSQSAICTPRPRSSQARQDSLRRESVGGSSKGEEGKRIDVGRAGLGRGIQSGQVLLELVHSCTVTTGKLASPSERWIRS